MKRVVPWVMAILFGLPMLAHAQAAALTGMAVKGALEGALASFQQAMLSATQDLQSLGNSLQSNAQNVILDIDRTLGSKINLTFDRLDASELRFISDAQALTRQVNDATSKLIAKAGDEARTTIVAADIAAYNASYSLPCRDATPRVLATFPARLIAKKSTPVIEMRGNFLRQGDLKVFINDRPAKLVERIDTSMKVEIPATVIDSVVDDEILASVSVDGLEKINRNPRVWGLFGCGEKRSIVSEKPLALTVVEPPFHYTFDGSAMYEHTASRDVPEATQQFSRTGNDRCDDSSRADQQWCVSTGTLAAANVSNVGANCSSGWEGTVPSGDRCVLARGFVGGCGANRGPFNTWLGCRGRGWLNYQIQLIRRETYQSNSATTLITKTGAPNTASFTFDVPVPAGLINPQPRYSVTARLMQGKKIIQEMAVSHAAPNSGTITSRLSGGVLGIDVP